MVKLAFEAAELARLYVDERLTARDVAQRVGCSETTIRRRLRSHGLAPRSRGPRQRQPAIDGWTRESAYAIGLLATDGNLSKDGRHLSVTSADPDLLDVLRASLALQANVRQVGPRGRCYRVQWSDRRLYKWLESLGLSPAKSSPSAHLLSRISILRTSLVVASMATDPSLCTWIATIPGRIHATSMNACMSRWCLPVGRSSTGSEPACSD